MIGFLLHAPLLGTEPTTQACMCPDQESNQRPLALWNDAQAMEPRGQSSLATSLLEPSTAVFLQMEVVSVPLWVELYV